MHNCVLEVRGNLIKLLVNVINNITKWAKARNFSCFCVIFIHCHFDFMGFNLDIHFIFRDVQNLPWTNSMLHIPMMPPENFESITCKMYTFDKKKLWENTPVTVWKPRVYSNI